MARPNLYETLGVSSDATHDEIKKSYQNLVLKYHPDKGTSDSNKDFIEVDEAWKVLRDPEKRKQYDAEMGQARFDDKPIVHETLTMSDFVYDPDDDDYYHQCRCGGLYWIPDETEDTFYLPCDQCSLVIKVIKNPNDVKGKI